MGALPPESNILEGAGMTDYETLSLVIMIIGLVVSTVMLGITIGSKKKDDRHCP